MVEHTLLLLAALFSVLNPLGALPIFLSLTGDYTREEKNRISLKTSINVFGILIISFFIGSYFLEFFGISLSALQIAGGLIIISSGFALLGGKFVKSKGLNKKRRQAAAEKDTIAFTPLAMPMIAGPGAISLLIATKETVKDDTLLIAGSAIAIVLISIIILLMLRGSNYLFKILGTNGINAVSRILGFIVIAIGIQYIINGSTTVLSGIF